MLVEELRRRIDPAEYFDWQWRQIKTNARTVDRMVRGGKMLSRRRPS